MRLTYADRQMVLRVLESLNSDSRLEDRQLLEQAHAWASDLRPATGYETALLRDLTSLCNYLFRLKEVDLKEIARGAIHYILKKDDLISDDTPLIGLQDDAYVAAFSVHEIRSRLGEPSTYSPPRLTGDEKAIAERMFLSFRNRPLAADRQLMDHADAFCIEMGRLADSGFFGRLCRNVRFLRALLEAATAPNEQLSYVRAALSYLNCEDDAIDDRLAARGVTRFSVHAA